MGVEKLERILHAEEAARARLSDARDEADRLRAEATHHARTIRDKARAEAIKTGDAHAARILDEARARVASIHAEAAAELQDTVRVARERMTGATDAVLREMVR